MQNVIMHLETLLLKQDTLAPAWISRLNYMLKHGYDMCFKNEVGTFCYRRTKTYHIATSDMTKDVQPV